MKLKKGFKQMVDEAKARITTIPLDEARKRLGKEGVVFVALRDVRALEREGGELPLAIQAELLGLNRTGLYYMPAATSPAELALKRRIDEVYTAYPFYGVRRVTAQLRREEWAVNHKAVARHMREMGLAGIAPKRNLSKPAPGHRVYPYLLRGLAIERPDQV